MTEDVKQPPAKPAFEKTAPQTGFQYVPPPKLPIRAVGWGNKF